MLKRNLGLLFQSISEPSLQKIIRRNHYFNWIFLKRETRSQSLLIWKSVNTQRLQNGFWSIKNQRGAYIKTFLFINNSFTSQEKSASLLRWFYKLLSKSSSSRCALCISWGALRTQGALRISTIFHVLICSCATHQRCATHWARRATHWVFRPETCQQAFKSFLNSSKLQVGFISMAGFRFARLMWKNYDKYAMKIKCKNPKLLCGFKGLVC